MFYTFELEASMRSIYCIKSTEIQVGILVQDLLMPLVVFEDLKRRICKAEKERAKSGSDQSFSDKRTAVEGIDSKQAISNFFRKICLPSLDLGSLNQLPLFSTEQLGKTSSRVESGKSAR